MMQAVFMMLPLRQYQLILKPMLTHLDRLKRKGGGLRPKPEPSDQGADGCSASCTFLVQK